MNLYRLRRKNITLGATRPRYMFVAAKSEDDARRLAQYHSHPLQNATDPEYVACVLVKTVDGSAASEHVIGDFREGATIPPPAHWMEGEIESNA